MKFMIMMMMMVMMIVMMEIILFVPVEPEVLVNKVSSQRDVGVLGAGAPYVSGCSHTNITEVHKKLDNFREYLFGILTHLLPVGACSFDVEAFVEEANEVVELRAVDEAEGKEVAANQLQQQPVELPLERALRVNLGILVQALLHRHLPRDQLWLPVEPVRHISLLGLFVPSHILPLGPVLPLQVPSEGLRAPPGALVLDLISSRQTDFTSSMLPI